MPKLNHFGKPTMFGCPGCDGKFTNKSWSIVKHHMRTCYPSIFDQVNAAEDGDGHLRRLCKLGGRECIVPGHTNEVYEAERKENKKKKQAAKNRERQKPKWSVHDDKLEGGEFVKEDVFATIDMQREDITCLVKKLENEFDQFPDGPYGVQGAMGSRDDWIHWSLQLAQVWSRASVVIEEYQNDISRNMHTLDTLGKQTSQGYQGSHDYVRALHCIFHDTFYRCHLPFPPLMNLDHAITLRDGDGSAKYRSRMRSFNGYKFRAFGMIQVVSDNPLTLRQELNQEANNEAVVDILEVEEESERKPFLPRIRPIQERRKYKFPDNTSWDYYNDGGFYNTRYNNRYNMY